MIAGLLIVSDESSCKWALIQESKGLWWLYRGLVAKPTHGRFCPLPTAWARVSSCSLVNNLHGSFLDENWVNGLNATIHGTLAPGCPPIAVAKDATDD